MNYEERRLTILVSDFFIRALPKELLWSHFPAGEKRAAKTAALLKRMGLQRGWPDFILILGGGRAAFIELKVGDGKLSERQEEHEAKAQALGALWAECHSLNEVQAVLEMWGIKLRATV